MSLNLIDDNPFEGLASKIKFKKANSEDDEIDPFTKEERKAIIECFKSNRYYNHYANYVQFLFLTGARPSEVIALQWKHISTKSIKFEQAIVKGEKGLVLKDGLKTQQRRKFPVNVHLLALINEMAGGSIGNQNPEAFVFLGARGEWIHIDNFRDRAWKTVLSESNVRYRKPYQTRHTFITMAIEAGVSLPQVAKWAGNSPQVIMEHYAGTIAQVNVPEF